MGWPAIWYDGKVAVERFATVTVGEDGLRLADSDSADETIALALLIRLRASHGRVRFGRRDRPGWRLVLGAPLDPALAAALPAAYTVLAPPVSRKAVAISGTASIILAGLLGSIFLAPQLVARQMPMALERRIGNALELPQGLTRCDDPAARAAIDKIIDRIDPEARADGFTVEFIAAGSANAAALPGGRIVLLTGLMDVATDSNAIAGVLAHEIAHVRRRHVAAAAVRQLGLRSIVALMGGDIVAGSAGGLLSRKFSRTAEAEADDDSVAMLGAAGIDPRSTAELFDWMSGQEGEFPEWLGDHPASAGRAAKFTAARRPGASYRPILSGDEEDALFNICRSPQTRWFVD